MNQTKLESMIESFCNNGSAFIISVCLWHWVVGPLWDAKILTNAFEVTIIFTIVSFIRSYLWRRFFNAGLHRLVRKFFKRKKSDNISVNLKTDRLKKCI